MAETFLLAHPKTFSYVIRLTLLHGVAQLDYTLSNTTSISCPANVFYSSHHIVIVVIEVCTVPRCSKLTRSCSHNGTRC